VGYGGIIASIINNCSALDCGSTAISGNQVSDCRGQCSGSADGLAATTAAQNCYGYSSTGTGLAATTAQNCCGYTGTGTGLAATTAQNCYGSCNSGTGLSASTAQNCYGFSYGSGYGLWADYSATGCYGHSSSGTGLIAFIANVCHGDTGIGTALSTTHNVNSY
jgi:hypothetical protein